MSHDAVQAVLQLSRAFVKAVGTNDFSFGEATKFADEFVEALMFDCDEDRRPVAKETLASGLAGDINACRSLAGYVFDRPSEDVSVHWRCDTAEGAVSVIIAERQYGESDWYSEDVVRNDGNLALCYVAAIISAKVNQLSADNKQQAPDTANVA